MHSGYIVLLTIFALCVCVSAVPLPHGGGAADETADQCGLGRLQACHSRRHAQGSARAQADAVLTSLPC
jgi:hypothetical protein